MRSLKIAASGIEVDRPFGTNDSVQNSDVTSWGKMNFDSSFATPVAMVSQLKSMGAPLMALLD